MGIISGCHLVSAVSILSSRLKQPSSYSVRSSTLLPLIHPKWLLLWPRPSPAAGGWRLQQSLRTCFSLLCFLAGRPCSSCSSRRASTLTCAKDEVSLLYCNWVIMCGFGEGVVYLESLSKWVSAEGPFDLFWQKHIKFIHFPSFLPFCMTIPWAGKKLKASGHWSEHSGVLAVPLLWNYAEHISKCANLFVESTHVLSYFGTSSSVQCVTSLSRSRTFKKSSCLHIGKQELLIDPTIGFSLWKTGHYGDSSLGLKNPRKHP